jgi:hypothetical protein
MKQRGTWKINRTVKTDMIFMGWKKNNGERRARRWCRSTGVVSSIGVTEFLVDVTGIREPNRYRKYRCPLGTVSTPPSELPKQDCFYCNEVYGRGDKINSERYFE